MTNRAGQRAQSTDLIDVDALITAYYELVPDMAVADQRVAFGTSGHRGSSLDTAFNEQHILATTQAIVDYRNSLGIAGPLFMGMDTHALSQPALITALDVLTANNVHVLVDSRDGFTPTPAVSFAIIEHNRAVLADAGSTFGLDELATFGSPELLADGIVITPSHNPPRDGGFKYNPTHGGPADTDATSWIASRANELIEARTADGSLPGVSRVHLDHAVIPSSVAGVETFDFLDAYVTALAEVIDLDAIAKSGARIGADPLGGASVAYWSEIRDRYGLNLTVLNPEVDPRWSFMTLDWDGKIRMDPSSPNAMASLIARKDEFDLITGNDADSDRHGIVTPDGGLMNPNHYLAVCIDYLFQHRPNWSRTARVGKTLVSSSIIDRVTAALGRELWEVPVGIKWFVPGLVDGSVGFAGEESAGASFLRTDGSVWTTDKDGIILALLASEILAVTGKTPSQVYRDLTGRFGDPVYERMDAPADREAKARLSKLSGDDIAATELAGDPIIAKLSTAPGNGAALGGVKVITEFAWFAARPSGTENVYKIYAESFRGAEHLALVQAEARVIVDRALGA